MAASGDERGPRKLDTVEFTARLGAWHSKATDLRTALANAIRSAIQCGDLRASSILPPQRDLARTLAVSRSTVVAAFDTLRKEGWLETRQGSATWVRDFGAPDGQKWLSLLGMVPVFQQPESTGGKAVVNLAAAVVRNDASLWQGRFSDALQAAARQTSHGYLPAGLPQLRTALAEHLTARGLPTEEEQILITSGAQQAIYLAAAAWLQPGDAVLVERPGYAGALEVFRTLGARAVGVPGDSEGPCPAAVSDLAGRHRAKLLFLTPTCNNPTGRTLSQARRRHLAEAARRSGLLIIEDAALQDLYFASEAAGGQAPPGYLAERCSTHEVVLVGSLSKLFWGGLRIGWLRAKAPVVRSLSRLKAATDLGSPVLNQLLGVELLADHHEIRARRRAELSALHDLASGLITELIPEWRPSPCSGGLALWVSLPEADAVEFAQTALGHGVAVVPGPIFDAAGEFRDHLRVSFAVEPDELRLGIERLATAWRSYRRGQRAAAPSGAGQPPAFPWRPFAARHTVGTPQAMDSGAGLVHAPQPVDESPGGAR